MNYDIHLRIAYEYAEDVADARHLLRIRPRASRAQRPSAIDITIEPGPDERSVRSDFHGNARDEIAIWRPHRRFEVNMRARVGIERAPYRAEETPTLAAVVDAARSTRENDRRSPMWFLGGSRRIHAVPSITAFAKTILAPRKHSSGAAVLALSEAIRANFAYLPGSSDVATSIEATFSAKAGVCQDFAHVTIAALRSQGIPAGYVSGFLRTDPPPGEPRLEGADAMHAWVTAWLGPEAGWVDFDPTNGIVAGNDHITVAIGRDYDDVTPIAGVLTTNGTHTTTHSVDVVPLTRDEGAGAKPETVDDATGRAIGGT